MEEKKAKNVVITGAAGGIGQALIEKFASKGWGIWALAHRRTDIFEVFINEIEKGFNVKVNVVYCDMGIEEEVKEASSEILKHKQSIDALVNNAGTEGVKSLFTMTRIDDVRKTFEVNFFSSILLTQRLAKRMIKQKSGSIVNITSVAGIDGEPAQIGYVSSKAAMIGATKRMAKELAPFFIRVNAVAPGVVDTPMGNKIDKMILEELKERISLHRMATPNEIAECVYFLSSRESSYVNGQVLRVDGGM